MPRASTTYGGDGTIVIGTSVDVGGMNTGLKKIEKSFRKLNILLGGVLGVAGFVKLGKAAISAASDLQEVQNIVDVVFGDMSDEVDKFAENAIYQFGMSELAAKQTAGSFMAMGKAIGVSQEDAKDMSLALTALSGDMASFYNIKQEYARVALSAVYTGETETLKRYGIVLTEANLQEFARTQGIDQQVKKMDARSKAMIRYQYIMQQMNFVQGDFVRTSDNWANQVRILQQTWTQFLITLGNGLITVLTPVLKMLNAIISALIRFARIIGSILGNIFGIKFQSLADQNNAIADSAGAAADAEDALGDSAKGAGKKANKALSAWDDLNVLQQNTASGGGGGGGGGGGDFEIPDYDAGYSVFDKIKDDIMSNVNTLYGLGAYIGKAISDMLEGIDWQNIYRKASDFGVGLAQFLTGLISPELFASVGKTIANSLNTAIIAALAFARFFDWTDAGLSIAAGINAFFENFDFKNLADAIDKWVQGIFDMMVAAITNINWADIATKIEEFLANLDIKTIAIIIGALTISNIGKIIFFGGLSKLLSSTITPILSKAFGEAFAATSLGTGLTTLATKIGSVFGTILPIIGGVGAAIGGIVLIVTNFFKMWQDGFSWLNEAFMVLGTVILGIGLVIAGVPASIAAAIAAVVAVVATLAVIIHDNWDAIKDGFQAFINWIVTNVNAFGNNLAEIVKSLLTAILTVMANIIDGTISFIKGLWDGLLKFGTTIFNKIKTVVVTTVTAIQTTVKTIGTAIKTFVTNLVNAVHTTITNILNAIKTIVTTVITAIHTFITNVLNAIKNIINTVVTNIKNIINTIITAIKSLVSTTLDTIKGKIETILNAIKSFVSTVINNIKTVVTTVVNNIKSAISTALNSIKTTWNNVFTFLKTTASNIFNGIWTTIKSIINKILGGIEKFANGVVDGVNAVINAINGFADIDIDVPDWVTDVTGIGDFHLGFDFNTLDHISIPRLAKGGVIPANSPFMAMLGDQKHGTNIEAPLDTIVQAMVQALSQVSNMSSGGGNRQIVLNLDGQTLARLTLPYNLDELGRRGYNVSVLQK